MFVKADIGSIPRKPLQSTFCTCRHGTFPCIHCAQCSKVIKGDSIQPPRTEKTILIKGYYMCDSTFVVYLIKRPCGLIYVDGTSKRIKDKIAIHISTVHYKKWLSGPQTTTFSNYAFKLLNRFHFRDMEGIRKNL